VFARFLPRKSTFPSFHPLLFGSKSPSLSRKGGIQFYLLFGILLKGGLLFSLPLFIQWYSCIHTDLCISLLWVMIQFILLLKLSLLWLLGDFSCFIPCLC
jgi:hypothetical protein